MDIWAWLYEFVETAKQNRDLPRYQLAVQVFTAMEHFQTDPDGTLDALAQARAKAAHLQEARWVLFCDHWTLQSLLHHKRDYVRALPLAEQAAHEVHSPLYAQFPQRNCLQEDLITAYEGVDPFGYGREIDAALERMERDIPSDCECALCLAGLKTEHLFAQGRLAEAQAQAAEELRRASSASAGNGPHHAAEAYARLCRIAHAQADWGRLGQWAQAGLLFQERVSVDNTVTELLLWQATALSRTESAGRALAPFRAARAILRRLGGVPGEGTFNAWAAFYEAQSTPKRALRVREREQAALEGSGRLYTLCQCRLRQCRLKRELGLPTEGDADAVRALSAQMKQPERVLQALEDALHGA